MPISEHFVVDLDMHELHAILAGCAVLSKSNIAISDFGVKPAIPREQVRRFEDPSLANNTGIPYELLEQSSPLQLGFREVAILEREAPDLAFVEIKSGHDPLGLRVPICGLEPDVLRKDPADRDFAPVVRVPERQELAFEDTAFLRLGNPDFMAIMCFLATVSHWRFTHCLLLPG